MNVGRNNRLKIERGEDLDFRFVASPNVGPGGMNFKYLIIHATEGPSVQAAINTFTSISGGKSSHLILGRDGKEIVQMVDFSRRAQHIDILNPRAIGIELDYTGPLIEDPTLQHRFNAISKFQPGEIVYGVALNDRVHLPDNIRPWQRYPPEQLDALVPLVLLLASHYGLQVMGHEELRTFKLDPGPAFPMVRFRESLLGRAGGSIVYDEISQDVELRTGPGMVYPLLTGGRLEAGTLVSISDDHDGWGLVEVMAEVEGNRWLVGWTPMTMITARHATPVVRKHKLFTSDGRQYRFIAPHPNNYAANRRLIEPKYLVIHTTDALTMESTIHSFLDEKHKASAHLLIGRDGGVVQFVDFDTVAFHCGTSYWEEDAGLNNLSIGIEVDNAGFLSRSDSVWKWKTTIIPDEEVTEARHWKEFGKRGWHNFTEVQLLVLREIVQALQAEYGFRIVLGHDVINLPERADPGPLFPMADFQELVSGQPGLLVKVYQTNPGTPTLIYKNPTQAPPDLDHPRHNGVLPARTKVSIEDPKEDWTRVKVKAETGPFRNTEGWIRNNAVGAPRGTPKTTKDSEYFKLNPGAPNTAPWTFVRQSPLPPETRLRVEKFEGDFALIATLQPVMDKYLEGWVKKDALTLLGEERIPYPPVIRTRRRRQRERNI